MKRRLNTLSLCILLAFIFIILIPISFLVPSALARVMETIASGVEKGKQDATDKIADDVMDKMYEHHKKVNQ